MVDETEFHLTRKAIHELPCPFKKAIFSTICQCPCADRIYLGDRELMNCADSHMNQRCNDLVTHLKEAARFALQVTSVGGVLPHDKSMKVETGGLLGVQAALFPDKEDLTRVTNVVALIDEALAEYESLDRLPYPEIIREVARFTPKKRRRSSRR